MASRYRIPERISTFHAGYPDRIRYGSTILYLINFNMSKINVTARLRYVSGSFAVQITALSRYVSLRHSGTYRGIRLVRTAALFRYVPRHLFGTYRDTLPVRTGTPSRYVPKPGHENNLHKLV
jgi:hypothetical protein